MSEAHGTEAAAGTARPAPLRRNKGFRMLWIGQLLSGTGTEVGLFTDGASRLVSFTATAGSGSSRS